MTIQERENDFCRLALAQRNKALSDLMGLFIATVDRGEASDSMVLHFLSYTRNQIRITERLIEAYIEEHINGDA